MTWQTIHYNRNALYEQVWSKPISEVARSHGISDVALSNICRRLRVPLPWRGYWVRVRNGKKETKPSLPALRPDDPEEHVVERWVKPSLEGQRKAEFDLAAGKERSPEQRIVVPPELLDAHRLVLKTEKSLRSGRLDEHGRLVPRSTQALNINVSRGSLDRALRIVDTLLKELEARGYTVSVGGGEKCCTSVTVMGEQITLWLEEELDCLEKPLTRKEEKDKKENPWRYTRPVYEHHPNGKLALKIGVSYGVGGRQTWADGKKQRLEICLNKFIEGLVRAAESQLAHRLQREREDREWQEKERQRLEKQRREEEERQRVENLTQQIDAWSRARRIREYISEMRENTLQPEIWTISKIPLPEWMEWALGFADGIDPVAPIRKARQAKTPTGAESQSTS